MMDELDDQHDQHDHAAEQADLARLAAEHEDATWGDTERGRVRVPGVLSGDVGPKGAVSAQLTDLSRRERVAGSEVPPGSAAPHGMRFVLLPMLGAACVILVLVAALIRVAS